MIRFSTKVGLGVVSEFLVLHAIPRTLLFVATILATATPTYSDHPNELRSLRLNQIQIIGSHNSFKAAIDPALFDAMAALVPQSKALDYAHPPLTDQLNLGIRNLELDIYHDPNGGLYSEPLGLQIVRAAGKTPSPYDPQQEMQEPGFKVLHVHDIDFRSNCLSLTAALREMRKWSEQVPHHLPVLITLNLSDKPISLPGSVTPVRFDGTALNALDNQLLLELGRDKLILPDDVRGTAEDLETAVLNEGWPKVSKLLGRFLFVLDDSGRKRDLYLSGHPSLRKRLMFVNSSPGNPEAAVMIRNNPLVEGETITKMVQRGYLVRTRADSGTHEARAGDFSRFEAAKKSGAQIISTDYYLADWRLNPAYRVRFSNGRLIRANPISNKR